MATGSSLARHLVVSSMDYTALLVLNLLACRKRSLLALSNHGSSLISFSLSFYSNLANCFNSKPSYSSPFSKIFRHCFSSVPIFTSSPSGKKRNACYGMYFHSLRYSSLSFILLIKL